MGYGARHGGKALAWPQREQVQGLVCRCATLPGAGLGISCSLYRLYIGIADGMSIALVWERRPF